VPNREPNPDLFRRWLLIVYLPLGVFVVSLALVIGKILTGGAVWLVGLLGLYCVIPARLILETQRKGLELPKPPSSDRGRTSPRRRPTVAAPSEEGELPAGRSEPLLRDDEDAIGELRTFRPAETEEPPLRGGRTVPAKKVRPAREIREPVERTRRPPPRKSPQIVRRRALASIIGIGVLLLVGGILVVVGIGRVTSSFGLVMVGVGGFLMILSVTLPTFRLVDAVLRAVGRLLARRPDQPSRTKPRTRRRSA
jgi:hypothetical protein